MIFVDTSFFVALLDPRDKNHARAVTAFEQFQSHRLSEQLLTTNNVVLETITVARHEAGAREVGVAGRAAAPGMGLVRSRRTQRYQQAHHGLTQESERNWNAVGPWTAARTVGSHG